MFWGMGDTDVWRGGAPRVASFHGPLCIPKSHCHLGTSHHGGAETGGEVTHEAWSTRVVGLQSPAHPSSLPSSCVLPFVPLLLCRRGKMIKPKPCFPCSSRARSLLLLMYRYEAVRSLFCHPLLFNHLYYTHSYLAVLP